VPKLSAGLLVHRIGPDGDRQVLLVHPGGPFWAKKDDGAWSIPKGEVEPAGRPGEDHPGPAGPVAEADLLGQAEREFAEELGRSAPAGERVHLGEVVQSGGKHVVAWAVEGDLDVTEIASNRFELEWPPRSGRRQSFPEVDRAGWFAVADARRKLVTAQAAFLDRLVALLP